MNKKGLGLMDTLLFAMALIWIGAIIVFIFNPFNLLGTSTEAVRGLLGL